MTRLNPHPLRDAQIQPADEATQVDPLSRRIHERLGEHPHDGALPTAVTTQGHPRWKWGKPVDAPSNSGEPLIMSPSDLERAPAEQPAPASIRDVVARMKP